MLIISFSRKHSWWCFEKRTASCVFRIRPSRDYIISSTSHCCILQVKVTWFYIKGSFRKTNRKINNEITSEIIEWQQETEQRTIILILCCWYILNLNLQWLQWLLNFLRKAALSVKTKYRKRLHFRKMLRRYLWKKKYIKTSKNKWRNFSNQGKGKISRNYKYHLLHS